MALLYATGFDYFPDLASLSEAGHEAPTGGTLDETYTCSIFSRQSLQVTSTAVLRTRPYILPQLEHLYLACWYMVEEHSGTTSNIIRTVEAQNGLELAVRLKNDGKIEIVNPVASVLGTSTKSLVKDQWHYLEFKSLISNSISIDDVILRIDGEEWINLPATTDCDYFGRGNLKSFDLCGNWNIALGGKTYFDDVIIYDGTGSTWNSFQGPKYISTLVPDGNGNYSQWTRSGGSNNYEMVDDSEYDDDTSYVGTSTLSNIDTYTYDNLHASVTNIDAVLANTVGKKSAGTNFRTVVPVARISSTDYEHDFAATMAEEGYKSDQSIWEESPATSTAWTAAEINGAEFGIKVKS